MEPTTPFDSTNTLPEMPTPQAKSRNTTLLMGIAAVILALIVGGLGYRFGLQNGVRLASVYYGQTPELDSTMEADQKMAADAPADDAAMAKPESDSCKTGFKPYQTVKFSACVPQRFQESQLLETNPNGAYQTAQLRTADASQQLTFNEQFIGGWGPAVCHTQEPATLMGQTVQLLTIAEVLTPELQPGDPNIQCGQALEYHLGLTNGTWTISNQRTSGAALDREEFLTVTSSFRLK